MRNKGPSHSLWPLVMCEREEEKYIDYEILRGCRSQEEMWGHRMKLNLHFSRQKSQYDQLLVIPTDSKFLWVLSVALYHDLTCIVSHFCFLGRIVITCFFFFNVHAYRYISYYAYGRTSLYHMANINLLKLWVPICQGVLGLV